MYESDLSFQLYRRTIITAWAPSAERTARLAAIAHRIEVLIDGPNQAPHYRLPPEPACCTIDFCPCAAHLRATPVQIH